MIPKLEIIWAFARIFSPIIRIFLDIHSRIYIYIFFFYFWPSHCKQHLYVYEYKREFMSLKCFSLFSSSFFFSNV